MNHSSGEWSRKGGKYRACRGMCGGLSPVLNELLQLLDLATEFFGRREAFGRLHEERRHLVAAEQAGDAALQPVEHAGLHHSCRHKTSSSIFSVQYFFVST